MMTGVGVILGTAAYMAPEQAKGRPADKRSDIWAFGCVLYEMLTGKRPFDGDDVSDTLANVLKTEPGLVGAPLGDSTCDSDSSSELSHQGSAAAGGRHLYRAVCPGEGREPRGASGSVARHCPAGAWRRLVTPVAAALVTLSVVGAGMWFATRAPEAVPPRISRLQVTPSGTAALTISGADRDLAITPDGSRLIYVGNRGSGPGAAQMRAARSSSSVRSTPSSRCRCSPARRAGRLSPPMACGSASLTAAC